LNWLVRHKGKKIIGHQVLQGSPTPTCMEKAHASSIPNHNALLPLESLFCPTCAFPFRQACDLRLREAQIVERAEESSVPGVTREANTMRLIRVVEAWILGFLRGEVSIECLCLEADFRNEVALKQSLEVLRVGSLGLGE
jgi:hypothetical protein